MIMCAKQRLHQGAESSFMTKGSLNQTIESQRFRLVPLNKWQAFRITYPWTKDSEFISSYSGSGHSRKRWRWYREMTRPNGRKKFAFAIIPHGETKPIGIHNFVLSTYRSCFLAVSIADRSWWGKGVVQEVRTRLIDHVFEHTDTERLHAQVMSRNFPSIFNYRKHGFTHVGTLHRVKIDAATGEIHDALLFEMFRDEWMARKAETDE